MKTIIKFKSPGFGKFNNYEYTLCLSTSSQLLSGWTEPEPILTSKSPDAILNGAGHNGEIITDKESGKDLERAGYQALKNAMLRRGDTLVVKSLDRLSRNKADIHNELRYFKENGIRLKVIDLPTTMMDLPEGQEWVFDMVNNILIEVLGTIAEQERETIRKRQAEGIEAAKANGKKLGRPALTFPANWDKVYASWKSGEITAKTAMEMTDTKRTSFYKLVGMMEEE